MKARIVLAIFLLLSALPALTAPRIALLVVSRSTDASMESHARSIIARLVLLRKSAGYTREQVPVLAYHAEKQNERDLCTNTLAITEDDLPFVGIVEVGGDQIPTRVIFRINRSENAHKDANTVFDEVHEALRQTASSRPAASLTRTRRNAQDGSVLTLVPAGSFTMGAERFDDERPPHVVRLRAYYMARDEVTNAQFRRFVEDANYHSNGHWEEYASKWGDRAPVVDVSWNDAQAYCNWAHLRLPTEAEWEKAARGSDGRIYPWGNQLDLAQLRGSDSEGRPSSVGTHAANHSPYGCLDMVGNVWEWTASWYERYPGNQRDNRAYGGTYRVLRGGSWRVTDPQSLTSTVRLHLEADHHFDYTGFRPAADP